MTRKGAPQRGAAALLRHRGDRGDAAGKRHARIGIENDRGRHPGADPSVIDIGEIGFDLQRCHLRKLRERQSDEDAVALPAAAALPTDGRG